MAPGGYTPTPDDDRTRSDLPSNYIVIRMPMNATNLIPKKEKRKGQPFYRNLPKYRLNTYQTRRA